MKFAYRESIVVDGVRIGPVSGYWVDRSTRLIGLLRKSWTHVAAEDSRRGRKAKTRARKLRRSLDLITMGRADRWFDSVQEKRLREWIINERKVWAAGCGHPSEDEK